MIPPDVDFILQIVAVLFTFLIYLIVTRTSILDDVDHDWNPEEEAYPSQDDPWADPNWEDSDEGDW